MPALKRLALFGSTGSIGTQTLDVASRSGNFEIVLLAAKSNWQLLAEQALRWEPEVVVLADESHADSLCDALSDTEIRIEVGADACAQIAKEVECDIALNALVGVSGLIPSYELLARGIDLALANKESLVLAGEFLNAVRSTTGAALLPVDSEHSAIFQCLQGEPSDGVRRLILTASGGPFREWSADRIAKATVEEALNHPTWKMGAKVTVDSASLMNKGLEVMEAYHLFGIPPERIEVRVHPVSIVHSMVQFCDGSFKAQLGRPDMRLPIQYALNYPSRSASDVLYDDEPALWPSLSFHRIEAGRYPCLDLAYKALELGGTATAVVNGADEVAVERFLAREVPFGQIPVIIAEALRAHRVGPADNLSAVIEADAEGRRLARDYRS